VTDPFDAEGVRSGVDVVIADHMRTLRDELAAAGLDERLGDELTAMASGGKRLRAAFCYWSWRAHRGAGAGPGTACRRDIISIGAALELFQAAALIHDDVMDASDTRRGRPTAHRSFADLHADQGWSGPSLRFGESVAILLGDLALIAAERVFDGAVADLSTEVRRGVEDVFGRMRTEVMAGQYLDLLAQAQPLGSDPPAEEDRARAVTRAKSARYTVEHPLVLGAAAAAADGEALARMRRIGLPLGEAFQLRDDLLGVFGDPATTGKPAGDDLREGKRTVLVARAAGRAEGADRRLLTELLGRRDLTDAEVDALRAVLRCTGADEQVEDAIRELADPALAELAAAPLAEPGRSMLAELARAAIDRQS
jgi:geranylgeranyl diphosphate synthase type I